MATAPTEHTAPVAWRENTRTKKLPDAELLTRTSWVDARTAHRQVKRKKADGNLCALWLRMHMQHQLQSLGSFIQRNCGKVLVVGLILLSLCCVGLKTAVLETNVQQLWVEAGGRLQTELAYTEEVLGEGSGITSELVIQTPKTGGSVLDVDSLLLHYEALKAATKITVEMDDITWRFRDICMTTNFPSFENHLFDMAIENLLPCIIITPLDCFWEGSKLLGPDYPVFVPYYGVDITWKNLNPLALVEAINASGMAGLPMDPIVQLMHRAGITSAYQEKPCLDPADPECPPTAPNKQSATAPAVAAEMTGGCSGFADRYMHWEEDLIIGGAEKNKTGHLLRAEAIQSVIQLMGEQELYEYHRDTTKVHSRNTDWNIDKARLILQSWQRQFTQEVSRVGNVSNVDNIYPFSGTSLIDILHDFSQISTIRVAMGYVLMVIYACVSMLKWSDAIQSQSGIGIAGVLLVALSVAAGLGMCSVIGVKFNASTTQILPFLALGIGVDDMFLIAHAYAENANKPDIIYADQTAETLKRTGVSVVVTSLSNMAAFFMAAIIPIPALRSFALQAAILVIFNCVTILVVYPAIISIDLIRREEKKMDVFCCFTGAGADTVIELSPQAPTPPPQYREPSPPPPYSFPPATQPGQYNSITHTAPDGSQPTTTLSPGLPCAVPEELPGNYRPRTPNNNAVWPLQTPPSTTSSRQCLAPDGASGCSRHCGGPVAGCSKWSLTWFAREVYTPQLEKTWVKVFIIIGFIALFIFGIIGITRVVDGLDLTDIVPRETQEYKFLEAQDKYFGFYNMYAVTKREFDYASPEGQKLLLDYHQGFQHVQQIIKKEDGTLPRFWLQLFRDWLLDLQEEFNHALSRGNLSTQRWFHNASDEAILAYKLMVQTGDIDRPIDDSRILHGRLVEEDGTINQHAFYNYLSAWASNDALAYSASMANLHPLPKEWFHVASDNELRIPKSQPLIYAQIPFYLNNMGDTEAITACISKIRSICEEFSKRGLPNYPSGVPFTYWEQYLNLRLYLGLSLLAVLVAIFLVITCVLANPWTAFIVVLVLTMLVVELFGFMGLIGIKLSAVPAVVMIVAVGIGVEFTVHIVLGFLTSIGPSNHRMGMALEHMFAPVTHGAISTLLGVIMLATAEFDFIVKYFFLVLTALVFLGLLNGLVLLPVLLSMIGPRAEVIPYDGGYHIDPPSPEPSPQPPRIWRGSNRRVAPRRTSDCSLSTITEEPTQYSSHEIIVHPEVTVETTTVPGVHNGGRNATPSTTSCSSVHPSGSTVTTVTATAKLKVEVHTPVPGCVDPEHTYKSRKRRSPKDADFSEESVSEC